MHRNLKFLRMTIFFSTDILVGLVTNMRYENDKKVGFVRLPPPPPHLVLLYLYLSFSSTPSSGQKTIGLWSPSTYFPIWPSWSSFKDYQYVMMITVSWWSSLDDDNENHRYHLHNCKQWSRVSHSLGQMSKDFPLHHLILFYSSDTSDTHPLSHQKGWESYNHCHHCHRHRQCHRHRHHHNSQQKKVNTN